MTYDQHELDPARFQLARFSHEAARLLRQLILSGDFAPGERLNEAALAQRLQISRSPIREAVQLLAGQGLVRLQPGRGAFVEQYDVETLTQLGVVRQALEITAVRLALVRMSDAELREVRVQMDRTTDDLDRGVHRHLAEGAPDFHRVLAEGSKNRPLGEAIESVESKFMIARARSGSSVARATEGHREHLAILDAMIARDEEAAVAAMVSHLDRSMLSMCAAVAR